jgi:hypothetical protein
MTKQLSLFNPSNFTATVQIPPAPKLVPHTNWPYPGMTPETSAQASAASTAEYHEMLAAVIKTQGAAHLLAREVLAAVPQDWRYLCGAYAHGNIANWCASAHGIEITWTDHEGKGGHLGYRVMGVEVAP